MTLDAIGEATAVLATLLKALLAALPSVSGIQGAAARYAIGVLAANSAAQIGTGSLGAALSGCFDGAVSAGTTVSGMETVRLAMTAAAPSSAPAIAIANAGIRFALVAEARILAGTTFVSSAQALAALSAANDAFESAEDIAADSRDPAAYQALVALHAAVVRDLTTRAVSLPRLITFAVPSIMTAHALAYRLYGDAGRADELRQENAVIHPAFMPATGTALSE